MSKYSYKYRPHYGFTGFLIEFYRGSEDTGLKADFCEAIKSLSPIEQQPMNLWMNNEVFYPFETSMGSIEFTRDNYDCVFIMGATEIIEKIHGILKINPIFESLDANLDDYQLKKK